MRHTKTRSPALAWPEGLAILLALLFFCSLAVAQEPRLDEGGHKLVLKKAPDIETGIVSLVSGTVGVEGERFFVEHLTMFQPAMVVLIAADVGQPLSLDLAKFRYDDNAWNGETGEEGFVSHQFRTQGELKIQVKAQNLPPGEETGFYLMVWAAELPEPDLPPPVQVMNTDDASGGMPGWLKIGGGIILLIVIAMVFFRLGRKS